MVLSQTQIGIFGAIRGFPARKGASRTVDGMKQYTLYTENDVELVGGYDKEQNLVLQIVRLPKRSVLDTYTFPVKTGTSISQGEVDGIYNDFVNQLQQVQAQEEQEMADSEKVMQINVLQEEQVGQYTIKLTEILDAYFPSTQTYGDTYEVSVPSEFGGTKNFSTLSEAQAYYEQIKQDIMMRRVSSTQEFDYSNYKIIYQETSLFDGTFDLSQTFYRIEGLEPQYQSTFSDGDIVEYRGATGTEAYGTISLDVQNDLIILKQYLDIIDNPPTIEGEIVGVLPIYSWGWYQSNNDNVYCPFETLDITNGYTVAETNGRILGLEDDDNLFGGFQSGLIKLKVKEGYRVQLKIMTQERGFLESNIPNLDSVGMDFETYNLGEAQIFNQATNYVDTEKVKIDLYGGDTLEINIDGLDTDPRVKNFYLSQRGEQISAGGGMKINDETFLAVIEVERYEEGSQNGDSGNGGTSKPMTFLPILIGGVLILGILYLVFAGGGEE